MLQAGLPADAVASKTVKQQKQDRAAALQQLRSHERAQLEKLRQLKQRRRSQQLAAEQQQVEELYRSDLSASGTIIAQVVASVELRSSGSTISSSQAAAAAAISRQQQSQVLTAQRPEGPGLLKPPAKQAAQLQNLFNPVANLPSFSSVSRNSSAIVAASSRGRPAVPAKLDVASTAVANGAAANTTIEPSSPAVATPTVPMPAEANSSSATTQQRRPSKSPAKRASVSPTARAAAGPAAAEKPSRMQPKTGYDKPWRANMRASAVQPAPGTAPAAAVAAGNAAEQAAAQLFAAAADAAKPVAVKSKKRSAEEQAQLQVCVFSPCS